MQRSATILMLLLSLAGPVLADEIRLTNGQVLEGIVIREDEAQLVVQIAAEGHIVLDRSSIAALDTSSDADRQALLERWREEQDAFKAQEARERAFEDSQRAKGLSLYRGDWVTKDELDSIKAGAKSLDEERHKREAAEQDAQRETEARKKLEGELTSLTDRLARMQEEQARLQQEINSLRYVLARRRSRQWVIQFPPFVREPNGRQFPVRILDDRMVIELTDGTHCDLEASAGAYRYRDSAGLWHEVQPSTTP